MSDGYVTDPELLRQLNGESATETKPAEEHGYVTDPALLQQLNAKEETSKPFEATPAPQFAVPGETGLGELATDVAQHVGKPVIQGLGTYARNPLNILADVGMAHLGVPPLAAAKNIYDAYGHAKETIGNLSKYASQFADVADTQKYFDLWNKAKEIAPGIEQKISELYHSKGGGNAVKNWLTTSEEGKAFLNNPATKALSEEYVSALPSMGQQIGKFAGPVVRGVGKVLGPVGLGMNAYDAAQYAQQAELGPRLAAGQGQIAQNAFRNVQANAGSQYQLQPQEAANVLASGDPATINLYGGPERLQQIAGGQSPSAPPTSTNFLERMKSLAHQYAHIGS